MKKLFAGSILFYLFFLPLTMSAFSNSQSSEQPIRILLVPGHDKETPGAEYGSLKEADLTLALATKIFNLLKKDKRFQVFITRDKNGYTKEFSDYLSSHKDDINTFKEEAKKNFKQKVADGAFVPKARVYHNAVSEEVAVDLYGINKWADENKIDAVMHIHFNDYPRKNKWVIGKYKGFAVYMPEAQMPNAKGSDLLAEDIYSRLIKKYGTSTLKEEKGGLIPEQNLIALGAKETLLPSVRSVLIEYGYIYEKKFRTISARAQTFQSMSGLTVAGIKNYFVKTTP